jgi:hypothetical protein
MDEDEKTFDFLRDQQDDQPLMMSQYSADSYQLHRHMDTQTHRRQSTVNKQGYSGEFRTSVFDRVWFSVPVS